MIWAKFHTSKREVTEIEVRADSIAFGRARGSSLRTAIKDINFSNNVRLATAVLTGTDFGFSPRDDHHLGSVDIKVDATIISSTVRVTATLRVPVNKWDLLLIDMVVN